SDIQATRRSGAIDSRRACRIAPESRGATPGTRRAIGSAPGPATRRSPAAAGAGGPGGKAPPHAPHPAPLLVRPAPPRTPRARPAPGRADAAPAGAGHEEPRAPSVGGGLQRNREVGELPLAPDEPFAAEPRGHERIVPHRHGAPTHRYPPAMTSSASPPLWRN